MDYLDWQSDLSLEEVFTEASSSAYPSILREREIVYLSKDKSDNRSVLMRQGQSGTRCVTPSPFNLQTRVNEYGGKPYWVFDSSIIFSNQTDQCLYRQEIGDIGLSTPVRISCKPDDAKKYMYTDVHELCETSHIAIIELERSSVDNAMFIGAIGPDVEQEPSVLIGGADFYSNLVLNKQRDKVAWVQWNHPNMPWDETQLWVADVIYDMGFPSLHNPTQLQASSRENAGASICQLLFSSNDRLFFSADFVVNSDAAASSINSEPENYWNVHVYDFVSKQVSKVTADKLEFGYPHWVYGDHRIVQFTETELLTIASAPSGDELVLINQDSLAHKRLNIVGWSDAKPNTLQHLASDSKGVCVLERLPFCTNPSIVQLKRLPNSGDINLLQLVDAREVTVEFSEAQAISFDIKGGAQAYGFFYAPVNSEQQNETDSEALPPLLVMVHGGPTARAYGHFDLQKQFWTSRGFAILDVNHRGSSGYGRQFRDSLYGHWGDYDVADIIAGINYLVSQKKVDADRVCIRGKSAGGYAVLRALTEYPDTFLAGACYYGIGNLVTLAESTHKFEKHYTDRLIDEVFDPELANTGNSKFYQRSPINKMKQLDSAMIVFQGQLDRVVPPPVAKEIIDVLVDSGIEHEYVEYSNEGHGFKHPNNNIDAWQKEFDFYQRVLRN